MPAAARGALSPLRGGGGTFAPAAPLLGGGGGTVPGPRAGPAGLVPTPGYGPGAPYG